MRRLQQSRFRRANNSRLFRLGFALALGLAGPAGAAPQPPTYRNPVLDADFPDPAVLLGKDGWFYAYATQSERAGKIGNIQVARSRDLVRWTELGDALPIKPRWAAKTQDFWAPHVVRMGGRYVMYFSAKPDAAPTDTNKGLCLAVATAASPRGPFTDMGHPLQCGDGFVNIDPMAFRDARNGRWLLYWGSGFRPIKVQPLAPGGLAFAPGTRPRDLVAPSPAKGGFPALVEGAWLLPHGGFYYLFYSGDNCCGKGANYAVMVARSRVPTGPFQTLERAEGVPHSIILGKSARWIAPGHNSIVTDRAGTDWIVYHAVDTQQPSAKPTDEVNTRRVMLIDRIRWNDGWPFVGQPSDAKRAAPLTRVSAR